ncbi:MAG: AmmeMemoRadiSam system protein B [Candidatus Parcubacteria bacterium]|nr:AmmeMemoRadiSam system protein B [Candidatus Parcubacteria bacterium]
MKKYFHFTLIIMVSGAILPAVFLLFLFGNRLQGAAPDVLIDKNLSSSAELSPEPAAIPDKFQHQAANFDLNINAQAIFSSELNQIFALVVQHHLVATPLINRNFSVAADYFTQREKVIKQIVILSPNHFLVPKAVITSDGNWQTKYGLVANDQTLTESLVSSGMAEIDHQALEKEHGVFDLLPFVKYYFSEAQITPLVISENVTAEQISSLSDFLTNNLSPDSLIILSADFSHYLPERIADFHDQASIGALADLEESSVSQMDFDNPASLKVLFKYLANKNARRFVLLDNQNSDDFMTGDPLQETTSYVSGYYTYGSKVPKNQISLLSVGDLMLDRNVSALTKKDGSYDYPFAKLNLFFKGIDFKLANLEGPVTDFQSVANTGNHMQFTFSPDFLPTLQKYFQVFSLANNHSLNFGNKGLEQTRNYLKETDINFFGDPQNNDKLLSTIIEKNSIKVGLIGYHALVTTKMSVITEEIKTLKKKTDWVIVYAHWGNEYKELPSSSQIYQAHEMIDSGADLILGSHPHVIEPLEIYNNKVIFYSLGNFIFDQYFSQAVKQGLSVGIVLDKVNNTIQPKYYLMPLKISEASQAEVMTVKESQEVLDKLGKNSQASAEVKEMIRNGLVFGLTNEN